MDIANAQNPLDTFSRSFFVVPTCCQHVTDLLANSKLSRHVQIVRCVAKKSVTSWQQKWNLGNDTTQHTERSFAHANLLRIYYGFATGKLRGNWYNGLLSLQSPLSIRLLLLLLLLYEHHSRYHHTTATRSTLRSSSSCLICFLSRPQTSSSSGNS